MSIRPATIAAIIALGIVGLIFSVVMLTQRCPAEKSLSIGRVLTLAGC